MLKIKKLLPVFLLLCCNVLLAQERTVTGTVLSSSNIPIAGATVIQKSTKNATITSNDGSFSLKVSGGDIVLTVSSIGYST